MGIASGPPQGRGEKTLFPYKAEDVICGYAVEKEFNQTL